MGKQWKLLEGFAQRPNLFIQLPVDNTLMFQAQSRPIQIIQNSDPLSATHIGLRMSPEKLNGMMDRISFPFVTTHFISEFFVTRSRPIIVFMTKYSHAVPPRFRPPSPLPDIVNTGRSLGLPHPSTIPACRASSRIPRSLNCHDLPSIVARFPSIMSHIPACCAPR